ncbi:site-specific recombinase|uniref:site-specific recombinase n=1 Tax=Noviherbaspirillum sp. L7-7A TaxID=2850560 RepID=UPI001C2BDD6E|nr:site-specific recombinase [Noviherbaspirillum sp. L7-7A]MBV0878650.1 site-specific recombinase [Noviherbaspirillum sp. L7-7A]
MKMFVLRAWAVWRRLRRGASSRHRSARRAVQVEQLMRRANPFAGWSERANWMIDVAEWLRHDSRRLLRDGDGRQGRLVFLLDWLDSHRDVRRLVQTAIQKTLREAIGPELFAETGMQREPAALAELASRTMQMLLPRPPARHDMGALLCAMFPRPADALLLRRLDPATAARLWRLVADDAISHGYLQQIDEAMQHLATAIIAAGTGPEFRRRLPPRMPVQATPFMALRRELEGYLHVPGQDEAALRSVRMLVAVCRAQTDGIYADLDEHGVSVSLVFQVERMRAQLDRMASLISLRSAVRAGQGGAALQAMLADLLCAQHGQRPSVTGLASRSLSLVGRKIVERQGRHGERYMVEDAGQYHATWRSGAVGGALLALLVLLQQGVPGALTGLAGFFGGMSVAIPLGIWLLVISACGGQFGARQPAVTTPALGARMGALDTVDGLRGLMTQVARLLRAQAAGVLGNLAAVVPLMLLLAAGFAFLSGAPLMSTAGATAMIDRLSLVGPAPLYAAGTGVLLWLAGLASGFADNWFALHRLRDALAHQRRLVYALGPGRAQRFAGWLERHVADIAGGLALAVLLGMAPAFATFFGLPFQVRHVTLDAAALAAAGASLGWSALAEPAFWLAAAGVVVSGLTNVAIAFACAFSLALHARSVPVAIRRRVSGAVLRRFVASPGTYLLPQRHQPDAPRPEMSARRDEKERKAGRR